MKGEEFAMRDIGFRIKKINDLLQKRADQQMRELGLTFSQHHVLVYLVHKDEHTAALKEIEHTFRVAQATMAGIVVRLEEKGLVESYVSPQDKRIKMVRLTAEGEKVCEISYTQMHEKDMLLHAMYTDREMKDFDDYLFRLYEALLKEV